MSLTDEVKAYLQKIGAKGGAAGKGVTSKAKKKASRKNGIEGGRPRLYKKCPRYHAHRFNKQDRCPCGQTRQKATLS